MVKNRRKKNHNLKPLHGGQYQVLLFTLKIFYSPVLVTDTHHHPTERCASEQLNTFTHTVLLDQ